MIFIKRAIPDQASVLTSIALTAKRHWGYPERWIKIWTPLLTITPEFITSAEVWVAEFNRESAGFYALIFRKEHASLEHLWILPTYMSRDIGRALFEHALVRCREKGFHILEIVSDPNAQGFYERMGAKKVGLDFSEVDGQLRSLPILEMKL